MKVYLVDSDFFVGYDYSIEKRILSENGIELVLETCKNERDVIDRCSDADVLMTVLVKFNGDVMDACPKAEGMMMLVRSMAPEVIAVDEIGRYEDIPAIETVLCSGCRLIATVHGSGLADLKSRPLFQRLLAEQVFERYVILGQDFQKGRVRGILDGRGKRLC